ncbi:hypothetical protein RRG08_028379 [Elysia crispata]|uniref:Integrase catalytic domain-containing protein n=1 Tax=Elysia crispata TaxID=231223 RepID=A0AAE1BAD7_9GAST|nr:hypothetical protein RRG08_028379 [Elysia crispata]
MVQELKSALNKGQDLQRFLMAYRNTPHSTTGCCPAEMFLKHKIRTRLSSLKPNLATHVEKQQEASIKFHDRDTKTVRSFLPGDFVLLRNFRGSTKWVPATILQRQGPMTYIVRHGHREIVVHLNHLKPASAEERNPPSPVPDVEPQLIRQQNNPTMSTGTGRVPPDGTSSLHGGTPPQVPPNLQVEPTSSRPHILSDNVSARELHFKTKSGRVVKPPNKLEL